MGEEILDLFYPKSCIECGKPGKWICDECLKKVRFLSSGFCKKCGKPLNKSTGLCPLCHDFQFSFTACRSAFVYEGAVASGIKALKYSKRIPFASYFAAFLYDILVHEDWNIDLITAVPLYKDRLAERGFNQSGKIAESLSKKVSIPYNSSALQKISDTKTQVGLGREERLENLKSAFVAEPIFVIGKRILLIDDVMTTGSTFNECSQTLLKAGASNVFCLSIATSVPSDNDNWSFEKEYYKNLLR